MGTMKYDIFISCKSEDYKYAEEVYDFLTENHFKTFLASKELRKLGDSQYRESIEEALDTAEHIIVFSSNPEYPSSKYVKYEWGLFVDEKISGRKEGNILTVLKSMNARELPIGLRRYESFQYETYKESLLDYVETNQHKEYLLHLKEEEREKEAQKREAQEREKQKQIILNQIKSQAETFVRKQLELDLEIVKLRNLSKSIGSDKKRCKICDSEYDIEEEYCSNCGWIFHPLEGIIGVDHLIKNNSKQIDIHKRNHKNSKKIGLDLEIKASENSVTLTKKERIVNQQENIWNEDETPNNQVRTFASFNIKKEESYSINQILEKFIIQSKQQKSKYNYFNETVIKVNWNGLYEFIKTILGFEITITQLKSKIYGYGNKDFQSEWEIEQSLKRVLCIYQLKNDIAKFSTQQKIDWMSVGEKDIDWDSLIKFLKQSYGIAIKKWQLFSTVSEKIVTRDKLADRIYEMPGGNIQIHPLV